MQMNPGYMTFVVILTIGILLGSGWKDYIFKGLSYKSIVFFVAGWIICSFIKLHIHVQQNLDIQFNAAFIFLLLFSLYSMMRLKSAFERLNCITVSLVLCLLDFTFREATGLAMEYKAICLALAVAGLQKSTTKQLACLLLGFLCSNIFSLVIHHRTRTLLLADQSYQDLWWLTVLLSRLIAVLYENGVISFRKWYSGIFVKK
jgi:hypothetical protein